MATLTETAYYTRKIIKFSAIAIIAFIVLKIAFGVFMSVWLILFPPAPPPPNVAFGRLSQIKFPQTEIASSSANYNYSLETIEGSLSNKGQTMRVFFIPTPAPSFGAFDKMKAQAGRMGFYTEPLKVPLTTDIWKFNDSSNTLRHLEFDDTAGGFHLYYDYGYDLNLFTGKIFPTQTEILTQAVNYFNNLGLLSTDLSSGDQKLTYFKLDIDKLVPTSSLADADAVAVSFNKAPIVSPAMPAYKIPEMSFPIVSYNPDQGLVSILFSGSSDQSKKILDVSFYYSSVDFENYATYPTISLSDAFNNLKSGKAFVASIPNTNSKEIAIRKVYLAYFDSNNIQNYLQPVAVFSDEEGFAAYVPVILPIWLGE